jgi:hypothetical protein
VSGVGSCRNYKRRHANAVPSERWARGVNAKVLDLLRCVRAGFAIASVDEAPHGGVEIQLQRGADHRAMRFEFFEVPAVLQECTSVGLAK